MKKLEAEIPDSLWHALKHHVKAGSNSVDQVLCDALSTYLEAEPNTLFQVSTASALVAGIYHGTVTLGALRHHGDLGLGTFENLDGELMIVDGECFQACADGVVQQVGDEVLTPFALITKFLPTHEATVNCSSMDDLKVQYDKLRDSDNLAYALKVTGTFDYVHVRTMCRTDDGVPLVRAAEQQAEFKFENLSGTLVGFWSPEYVKSLNVPGYHLHFLSREHQKGGHLLDCTGRGLKIELQREVAFSVVLPDSAEFRHADFTHDPSEDLRRAESKP